MWRFSFRGGLVRVTVSGLLFFVSTFASTTLFVMRLLVLTPPGPLSWSTHYVAALRAQADCLVVGPAPAPGSSNATSFDAALSFDPPGDLFGVLPHGWEPDAVIGITCAGGARLHPGVAQWPWPAVFVSVDTWQCLTDYRDALGYDMAFVAQRPYVEFMRAAGVPNVSWLPLAANPDAHYPLPGVSPRFDVAFAGAYSTPVYAERRQCLEALQREYSVRSAEHVYGDAMCRLFAEGRIAFNQAAVREVNMRVFEALAMGRCLLTDRGAAHSGLLDLFEDEKELVTYDNLDELLSTCGTLLSDDARRLRIAEAGRARVLADHTYAHRAKTMLDALGDCLTWGKRPREARDARLYTHLPRIPGCVVDWGMVLGASRLRLERMGVSRVVGVHVDAETRRARGGSYHESVEPDSLERLNCDTFCADALSNAMGAVENTLVVARDVLSAGGMLVLRAPCSMTDDWEGFLAARGYNLVRVVSDGASCVLQARRRAQSLRGIVRTSFEALNLPGYDPVAIADRVPETW